MHVNDSSSADYSPIFFWEEVVLSKGYPGIEIGIGVRAGGAAPPVSENFEQNTQNSGNEETINKRLN